VTQQLGNAGTANVSGDGIGALRMAASPTLRRVGGVANAYQNGLVDNLVHDLTPADQGAAGYNNITIEQSLPSFTIAPTILTPIDQNNDSKIFDAPAVATDALDAMKHVPEIKSVVANDSYKVAQTNSLIGAPQFTFAVAPTFDAGAVSAIGGNGGNGGQISTTIGDIAESAGNRLEISRRTACAGRGWIERRSGPAIELQHPSHLEILND
jgi:hypothetical protein